MSTFSDYTTELLPFCNVVDLVNIILDYVIEKFTGKFIQKCLLSKNYLYYNKNKLSFLHYILKYRNRYFILFKKLTAIQLQNKDILGRTELYIIC